MDEIEARDEALRRLTIFYERRNRELQQRTSPKAILKKLLCWKRISKKAKTFFKTLKYRALKIKNVHETVDYMGVCPDVSNADMSSFSEKRIVVYTCVTGSYDLIDEPVYQDKAIEYVAFTDADPTKVMAPGWQIKQVPGFLLKKKPSYINRYLKFHPNEFFADYDYAIYIDGNVIITGDIKPLLTCINSETGLAMHTHSLRNCVYEEAKQLLKIGRGNAQAIKSQIQDYKSEGFPVEFGLLECTVIFTKIGLESKRIYDLWWEEFVRSNSQRDQLSLPYVLWKNRMTINSIGYLGSNVMNSPYFIVKAHL